MVILDPVCVAYLIQILVPECFQQPHHVYFLLFGLRVEFDLKYVVEVHRLVEHKPGREFAFDVHVAFKRTVANVVLLFEGSDHGARAVGTHEAHAPLFKRAVEHQQQHLVLGLECFFFARVPPLPWVVIPDLFLQPKLKVVFHQLRFESIPCVSLQLFSHFQRRDVGFDPCNVLVHEHFTLPKVDHKRVLVKQVYLPKVDAYSGRFCNLYA